MNLGLQVLKEEGSGSGRDQRQALELLTLDLRGLLPDSCYQ